MKKKYSLSLHIFRRDLRLIDNSALIKASQLSERVIPCFIFDKRQIENNDYKSDPCIQFMTTSLKELDATLREKNSHLYCFYGIAEDVVATLLESLPIEAIFMNRDYTPFSKQRDQAIKKQCAEHQIDFHYESDALLHEPEEVLKPNQTPYTIFTPAFKRAVLLPIHEPQKHVFSAFFDAEIALENTTVLPNLLRKNQPNLLVKGGRKEGLTLLKNIHSLTNYHAIRNFPALAGTTKLSAHNKFGTLSIREVYAKIIAEFGSQHTLITELHWRDFFTHIAFFYPHVFGSAFNKKYNEIQWSQNEKHFRAWREGRTGFPIVDAGMRELNTSGYMHNRVRMIAASFLTKDLHIDWRLGEQYFAQKLVDYDPAVNNGNWQWAASTGCDAQPYFRIFNPWLQQIKFDPDCLYIKRFIPELSSIPNTIIHQLYKNKQTLFTNYPEPIIDHAKESQKSKLMYKIIS